MDNFASISTLPEVKKAGEKCGIHIYYLPALPASIYGKRQTEPRPAAPRLNRQWLYEKDKRDGQRIIEATSPEKTVK